MQAKLKPVLGVMLAALAYPALAQAQPNAAENSGSCTVVVQGSNNNVSLAGLCSPTKDLSLARVADATADGAASHAQSGLQFTIREFVLEPRTQTVYLSMAVVNHLPNPVPLQLMSRISTVQLSDPPVSIPVEQVEGLGSCRFGGSLAARTCLDRAADVDSTQIPPGGTTAFRIIGRIRAREKIEVSDQTSGVVSLVFMRRIGNKYDKLDLSFLNVKLVESAQ